MVDMSFEVIRRLAHRLDSNVSGKLEQCRASSHRISEQSKSSVADAARH